MRTHVGLWVLRIGILAVIGFAFGIVAAEPDGPAPWRDRDAGTFAAAQATEPSCEPEKGIPVIVCLSPSS